MWATHILFVAWEKADEKTAEANAWARVGNTEKTKSNITHEKRKYKAVIYKDGRKSENLKKLQTGQIYILGHGDAGYDAIGDVDDIEKARLLKAQDVGDRLIASGLSKSFSGKIKCFNCHSSTAKDGKDGFAQRFAEYMRDQGYKNCQYFGYDSSLEAAYKDLGFDGKHKHALETIGESGRLVGTARASGKRKEVK